MVCKATLRQSDFKECALHKHKLQPHTQTFASNRRIDFGVLIRETLSLVFTIPDRQMFVVATTPDS